MGNLSDSLYVCVCAGVFICVCAGVESFCCGSRIFLIAILIAVIEMKH